MTDDPPPPRSIELEIEVAGTPEQVWEAIATGAGISAWMHPTEVEEHEGGRFAFDMGAGVNDSSRVRVWDPPRRFATEGAEWQVSEDAPPSRLAAEWIVEARAGGTCVVRFVASGFGGGADWDAELEGFDESMRAALANLRAHLAHFPGARGPWIWAAGQAPGTLEDAWAALTETLGLEQAGDGTTTTSAAGAPRLSGRVEWAFTGAFRRDLLLRLDAPAPGLLTVSVSGKQRLTSLQAHLYGDGADAVADREQAAWRAWMDEHFPSGA